MLDEHRLSERGWLQLWLAGIGTEIQSQDSGSIPDRTDSFKSVQFDIAGFA